MRNYQISFRQFKIKMPQSFNIKKISLGIIVLFILAIPILSVAQSTIPAQAPQDLKQFLCIAAKLALDFVPLVIVFTISAFLQGLIKYVASGDNEEKRMEGIKMMIYGVVGLFFMVSVWGILSIWTQSYGLGVTIPQFNAEGDRGGCNGGSSLPLRSVDTGDSFD